MSQVRVINVLELPAEMAHPQCQPERFRPVVQFIKDWNHEPEQRLDMLCKGEAPHGEPRDLAIIATVVHGLCARDGFDTPSWVASQQLPEPMTLSGQSLDTDWGRWVVSQAPPVCSMHGVYFEASTLSLR
ncbi:hypothetical protein [Candidatus Poriferisocius sp.]|uniref:hypothetical protein n=1 Tax=Candidatus Poriferisocius sp. TaxID=3101276 RepID=UPI003B599B11